MEIYMENQLIKGRILESSGGLYTVLTENGDNIKCKPRGKFRNEHLKVLVGDYVTLLFDEGENPCIETVCERKNALIRPSMANLDALFCVVAAARPAPAMLTLDKLISIADHLGIEPIIVVSKSDLESELADKLEQTYRQCGFTVFSCSSVSGDGVESIRTYIEDNCQNATIAFAGASGVGKSTLINHLFPGTSLETGTVAEKTGRGRHTTRAVSLLPLSMLLQNKCVSGFLADTPGFSMLDFATFDFYRLEDLPKAFREFRPHLGCCRYQKCTHLKEDGCAVIAAVMRGEIPQTRHESYLDLYATLKSKPSWAKKE
ncbi:MAG: ribosome small subunit-dependent GTPase A [Ruminococcaceae bacterium]|nr:ribosome small subunit-dependent GTPase A [Oscillospiraceae bacterium]